MAIHIRLASLGLRRGLVCQSRQYSSPSAKPLSIGIVGSGPAGFYSAAHLLKGLENVKIDMYEALPVPFGLVRFGVAPDHPEVKNVIHKFEQTAADPRFRFIGNVRLNTHISLPELASQYNALILSYGAAQSHPLKIPNAETTKNIINARDFVGWYNGQPEFKNIDIDLNCETAAVVGMGNVALDVARILLTDVKTLEKTDIARHAVERLRESKVKNVHLIARRGPLQVAFTAKELREMINLPSTALHLDEPLLKHTIAHHEHLLASDRQRRRLMELLVKGVSKAPKDAAKRWYLHFFRNPHSIERDSENQITGIVCEKTKLESVDGSAPKAVGTGELETISTGLLLPSIGYKAVPTPGLPFDDRKGCIPNDKGRVVTSANSSEASAHPEGIYVAGWLKRGPTGVIATTMYDAQETATTLLSDIQSSVIDTSSVKPGFESVKKILDERKVQYVGKEQWHKIDEFEKAMGEVCGVERVKIVDLEKMMEVAQS
ncbi:hypothetical protein BC832DRAFT_582061 [Gaertneriomyces semiglobifer]|nr:hypothetical protein BC832DRAFT_582061 [Gaertneriomyces semiglobifer]